LRREVALDNRAADRRQCKRKSRKDDAQTCTFHYDTLYDILYDIHTIPP
jgi:hypothetical protein